eukprot:TRINITY_DN25702_c0_g2_i1.p1 TRINITY_DN25702_c0_g2~~TRINITY_DN25702_c0_g2_i1.p1  ORF type:complete len:409 (+),score=149.22 TRINITY_DN25702_c0_g2_i1:108-1229(+)
MQAAPDGVITVPGDGVHCILVHQRGSGPAPSPVTEAAPADCGDSAAQVLLYVGDLDGSLTAWDVSTAKVPTEPAQRFTRGSEPAHAEAVNCICCGDDDIVYSCGDDRMIRLWDPNTREQQQALRGHASGVNAILIHNTILFSCDDDGKVRLWDIAAGHQLLLQLVGAEEPANSMCATAAGLWVSADDGVRLWPVADRAAAQAGQPMSYKSALRGLNCDGIAASPSGAVYVAVNPGGAAGRVVELTEGLMHEGDSGAEAVIGADIAACTAFVGADDHVRCPAVCGGLLFSGSDDGALFCWRIPQEGGAEAAPSGAAAAAAEADAAECGAKRAVQPAARSAVGEDEVAMAVAAGYGRVWCGNDGGQIVQHSFVQQ